MNRNFYIPASIHLKEMIQSIWQVESINSFQQELILPKGVVEIIFNFSDCLPISANLGSRQYYLPNCFINGVNKATIQLDITAHQLFFGVTFQPLAIKKIFGIPAGEFSDLPVDLALVDPTMLILWEQLAEKKSFDERVTVFCQWLQGKYFDWQPQDKLINHFLYSNDKHDVSVTELANSLCYSPRHLSRKIAEATAMNTEDILLYKKYLHAVHLIHHTDLSLTQIAHQSNFTDQSHFIRSFKAFANMTPGNYRRNKSFVMGHIFKNVR